jgi:hypothetical protein
MAFWTAGIEPYRAFRFKVQFGNDADSGIVWYAKTVKQPSFSVSGEKYQIGNRHFNIPGILQWEPIEMSFMDVKLQDENTTSNFKLLSQLAQRGYYIQNSKDGITHSNPMSLRIEKINSKGDVEEEWVVHGAYISAVSYSDFDYYSDELATINLTITYDYADIINNLQAAEPAP